MNKTFKLVEIIRYGCVSLDVHNFGIFDESIEDILKRMKAYNDYRGGKYPQIFVTEYVLNEEMPFHAKTKRYNVDTGEEINVEQSGD